MVRSDSPRTWKTLEPYRALLPVTTVSGTRFPHFPQAHLGAWSFLERIAPRRASGPSLSSNSRQPPASPPAPVWPRRARQPDPHRPGHTMPGSKPNAVSTVSVLHTEFLTVLKRSFHSLRPTHGISDSPGSVGAEHVAVAGSAGGHVALAGSAGGEHVAVAGSAGEHVAVAGSGGGEHVAVAGSAGEHVAVAGSVGAEHVAVAGSAGGHVALAGSVGAEHVAVAGSGTARRDRRWFRALARCRSETGAPPPLLHAVRRYADARPSGPRCRSEGTARVAGQRAVVRFGTQRWCGPRVGMARRDRRWFRALARCRSETGTPPPLSPRGSAVRGCAALRAAVPVGGRRSRACAPPCRPGGRRALPGRPYRAPFRTRVRAAVGSGVSLPPHRLTQAGPGTPLRRRRRSGGRPGHRPPPGDAFPLSLRPRSPRPPWARR